jgi:hypothetical protein
MSKEPRSLSKVIAISKQLKRIVPRIAVLPSAIAMMRNTATFTLVSHGSAKQETDPSTTGNTEQQDNQKYPTYYFNSSVEN